MGLRSLTLAHVTSLPPLLLLTSFLHLPHLHEFVLELIEVSPFKSYADLFHYFIPQIIGITGICPSYLLHFIRYQPTQVVEYFMFFL